MSGPLSLLGDVLMQGSRDYMAIRREDELRETARRQQLEDEGRRRQHQVADRDDARRFEQALYDQRRFDSIVDQLVRDGRISTADAKDPAKVNDALNKFGVQYRLKVEELAEYKAALPQIMKVVGKVPNAETILTMTATADTDMAPIRGIMQSAFTALGQKQEDMIKKGERNLEVGAALMAANMATQRGLYSRLEELNAPVSEVEIRREAEQIAAQGKGGVPSEAEIQAAIPQARKSLQGARQVEAYQIQQQLPAVSRQLDVIGDSVRSGTYGFMKDDAVKAATEGPVANTGKPAAPTQVNDDEEVIDFLSNPVDTPAGQPKADAQPASAPPIALGVDDPLGLAFSAAKANEQRLHQESEERARLARISELSRDIAQLEQEVDRIEQSGGQAAVVFGQVVPTRDRGSTGMFAGSNAPEPAHIQELARQREGYRRALQRARDELSLIQNAPEVRRRLADRPPALGI